MSFDNCIGNADGASGDVQDVDQMGYRLMSTAGMRSFAEQLLEDCKRTRHEVPRLTDEAVQALRAAYTQAADDLMAWACLATDHRRGKRTMQPSDVLFAGAIVFPEHNAYFLERNENSYGENALLSALAAKAKRRSRLRRTTRMLVEEHFTRRRREWESRPSVAQTPPPSSK